MQRSIYWGLGHTAVLFSIGFVILLFGLHFPPAISFWTEKAVASVLILYAVRIFQQFFRSRKVHNENVIHDHPPLGLHIHKNPSFWIGALHGLAGSAAIFILIISTFQSVLQGLFFILIFGMGSVIGMAAAGLAIGFFAKQYQKYTGIAAGIFSCMVAIFLFLS